MKNINESIINRVKLLMEYDTSKTLDENLSIISEAPNPFTSLAKSVSKTSLDDVIKSAKGGLKTTGNKVIKNSDDLIKALERNAVSAVNIGKVRTGLMKSSSLRFADKAALIDDFVKNPTVYNKYKNLNQRQITGRFKAAGYPDDVAKEIAKKIRGQVGQMRQITPKIKTALSDATQKVLKQGANKWNWGSWLKWGVGLGLSAAGVYAIIQYMKEDGTIVENPEGTPETAPEENGNTGGGEYQPKEDGAYTTHGDPYQYKVVNGQWHTKSWKNRGEIIKDWVSLENNPTATAELDRRHPGVRTTTNKPQENQVQNQTPQPSTEDEFEDIEGEEGESIIDKLL